MIIPWPIVSLIDAVAWPLGYQVYVTAIGGAGWHRGHLGADRLHFVKRHPAAARLPRQRG